MGSSRAEVRQQDMDSIPLTHPKGKEGFLGRYLKSRT